MECIVCEIRSSTTSCVECQALLCEECAVECEACGKSACPEHVKESRSGRRMCTACYQERKDRRRKRKGVPAPASTSLEELDDEAAEEEELEGQTLAASGYMQVAPWKLALYISLGALVIALILLIPSLRRVPLGADVYIPTHAISILMAVVATAWAIYGVFRQRYFDERFKCFISIGLAAIIVAISLVGIVTDPARRIAREARAVEAERDAMSQDQLETYRDDVLGRYRR